MSKSRAKSKAELKMGLVAKRLAMLQDDDDQPPQTVSVTVTTPTPIHYQSRTKFKNKETINGVSGDAFSKLPVSTPKPKDNAQCTIRDVVEDSTSEDIVPLSLPTPTPGKSRCTYSLNRKRSMVISDDDSEDDGILQLLVQPTHTKRTKRKRATSDSVDYLNDDPIAFEDQKNQIIKFVEPSDDSSSKNMSSAMKRAEEVQTNLPAEYPSFVKLMLPSHVSRVFWLHLPTKFCKEHLPNCDSIVKLVDEAGQISECNYLVKKSALSGGWRTFSLDRELNEGDVVVFQLIAHTIFKVYILRKGGLDEFDVALGLLRLDDCREQEISKKIGNPDSPPWNSASPSNDTDNLDSEVLDGICFADAAIEFEAIKDFDNFSIIVNGLVLDSKFCDANRRKYYELCCGQKSFLHEQLLKGLNCNLVIGIILETINIADGIRACTSATSIKDLRLWESTLRGFEVLGMKVNFLQAKLNLMVGVALDLTMVDESNGFDKCLAERASAAEKMRGLEDKLAKLKGVMEKINLEMEAEMTATTQKLESKLKQIANAPW